MCTTTSLKLRETSKRFSPSYMWSIPHIPGTITDGEIYSSKQTDTWIVAKGGNNSGDRTRISGKNSIGKMKIRKFKDRLHIIDRFGIAPCF